MTRPLPEILVDLGDMSDAPPSPDTDRGWAAPLRWLRFVVPVVAVLLLGAAGPPPLSRLIEVANVPAAGQVHILIDGTRLFVNASGTGGRLTAYGLGDGRPRWSADELEDPQITTMRIVDGGIVVSSGQVLPGETNTASYDVGTGRLLWSSNSGDAVVTGRGLLIQAAPTATTLTAGSSETSGYELVDPRTGAVLWSLGVPDDCVTSIGPVSAPTTIVELCDGDATLRAIDLADGRTLAQRVVPLGQDTNDATLDPDEVLDRPQLTVVGDAALVGHANAPTPTIDAYALADLQPLWGGLPEQQGQDIEACGANVCVNTDPGTGIVIDASTGRTIGPVTAPHQTIPAGSYVIRALTSTEANVPTPIAAGTDVTVGPDGNGDAWLEVAPATDIAPLPTGVGVTACVLTAGYLVCEAVNGRLSVWQIR